MFGADDEDGDFLSPSGGAKLASLFGLDQQATRGNETFQYTAPKQPRKTSNPALPPGQKPAPLPAAPSVVYATAVQAFKYIDGQYVKQGKLGAAVLGNHTTKEYKMLLYLSQQKQVTFAKIHVGFVFTVQPNNYCTFYDDHRQNWSLMFDSDKASTDFCKEVCLAKVNSAVSLEAIVTQELTLGEGHAVETGDSLEVVYTGWLLQNYAIGQMFDSNQNKDKLLRLRVGAGKVIKGWEEGLLGMKKSGRRFIIIPPNLAYGSKGVSNCVPANSTLIFETEVRRVKFSKDSGSDRASGSSRDSAGPSPSPSPAPSADSLVPESPSQTTTSGPGRPGEPPVRTKSNSLSEQLANPDATKAKLISRMAKMGQPMLPFLTGAASQPESSDSELEDTSALRAKEQLAAPSPVQIISAASGLAHMQSHFRPAAPSALIPAVTAVPPQPMMPNNTQHAFQPYANTQASLAPSPLQPVGQLYPTHSVPFVGPNDVTSFLMTEARQHNTEIRLAVGKVADKVDYLASKMDDLQRQGSFSMGVSGMSMETSVIMHNIQRIIQENECLKNELFEKSSRIEEQNRKIGELINQNQKYMEQSNLLMEQRNDTLKSTSEHNQAKLLQAEQDKVRLTEELASSTARLSQLQLEASSHQQKALELQGKLTCALQDSESHTQREAAMETQLEELKEAAEKAQAQYRSEKQERKKAQLRGNNLEEEIQDLKADKDNMEQTLNERKRKWQAERQRRDEEVEELRRSNQLEMDSLRAQLRKARTSTDIAASEQMSQLQLELEEEWKGKSAQAVALAEEQHSRDMTEVVEQRDALEQKLAQLQEKFSVLKQARDSEEQNLLCHRGQSEEFQALQEKYAALEQQAAAARDKLERQVADLEEKLEERHYSNDTPAEVKRVMNGVFHSLRREFDLGEFYSGEAVLAVIVSTIKSVTLQLLSRPEPSSLQHSQEEDPPQEEEEKEEKNDVKDGEEEVQKNGHVNGDTKVEEKGEEDVLKSETKSEQGGDEQVAENGDREVSTEQEKKEVAQEAEPESACCHSKSECSEGANQHRDSNTESKPHDEEAQSTDLKLEQEQSEHSVPGGCTGNGDSGKCADAEDGHDPTPLLESNIEDNKETLMDNTDDGDCAGKTNAVSAKALEPPANPPPPPHALQHSPGDVASMTRELGEKNGDEELFFKATATTKPPAPYHEEEEEDEMSLKGRPPPAPLFGDDDDDDNDLDWLNG